jgi:hypothetical protein
MLLNTCTEGITLQEKLVWTCADTYLSLQGGDETLSCLNKKIMSALTQVQERDDMIDMMRGLALVPNTVSSYFGQAKPGVMGLSSTQMKGVDGKAPTRKVLSKAGRDTPYGRYPPVTVAKPVRAVQEGSRG